MEHGDHDARPDQPDDDDAAGDTPLQAADNPMEDYIGYQLRRASLAMQADLNGRLAQAGITVIEMAVLLAVAAKPLLTQSDIGRMLAIKRANMTPLTAGLMKRGLVARQAIDGRSQGLRITTAGAALKQKINGLLAENEARIAAELTAHERETLLHLLQRVRKNVEG